MLLANYDPIAVVYDSDIVIYFDHYFHFQTNLMIFFSCTLFPSKSSFFFFKLRVCFGELTYLSFSSHISTFNKNCKCLKKFIKITYDPSYKPFLAYFNNLYEEDFFEK